MVVLVWNVRSLAPYDCLEGVIIIRRTDDDGQKTKEGEKKSFELQLLRSQSVV